MDAGSEEQYDDYDEALKHEEDQEDSKQTLVD